MHINKIHFITTILLCLLPLTSFAQKRASVGAMAIFGTGKMGNTTDVLDRAMADTAVGVFAGINIKKFRIGLNYEMNVMGQTANPTEFSNQNIGGKASAAGLRLDFYNGKTAFGLVYRASEKFTLDRPTASGATSVYDGKGGFSIQFYRQLKNRIGIVLDYSMGSYTSPTANTDDLNWSRAGLGLVFTNFSK
jgi:hypothetical protein